MANQGDYVIMQLEGEVLGYLAELYGLYQNELDGYPRDRDGNVLRQHYAEINSLVTRMNRLYDLLKVGGHPEFTQ